MTSANNLGILTVDRELIIRSWDAWLEEATGIRSTDAMGRSVGDVIPDFASRGFAEVFRRSLDEGVIEILVPRFHQYLIPCAPGHFSRRFARMQQKATIAPLKEDAKTIGLIVTVEDVTSRVEMEQDGALIDILDAEDWTIRRKASSEMARLGSDQAIVGLLRVLREQHRNLNVLNSALRVLTGSGIDVTFALIDLLTEPDAELRMYAALALGDLKNRAAVPHLIALLTDPDVNVQYHVIEALAKIGAPEAADELLRLARSGDFFLAFPAIDALAQLQDPHLAPQLAPLINDDLFRIPVVDALGRVGDEQVVPTLVELLASSGPHLLPVAVALVRIHERYQKQFGEGGHIADLVRKAMPAGAPGRLLAAMDSVDVDGLRAFIKVLSWIEDPEVVSAMTRLLGAEAVRKEVIDTLVRHGRDVTEALLDQLSDDDVETRRAAIIALGRIGDPATVPALIRLLAAEPALSVPAAMALSRIGDKRAYSALIQLLGHSNASVRHAAIAAINSLGDARTEADVARMISDANPNVRESAVRIAGYFGYPRYAHLVIESAQDPDESVRRAAIDSLPYIENESALRVLLAALREEIPRVRASAAQALGHIEDAEGVTALAFALADSDTWVRYYAARSLGRLAASQAVDRLGTCAQSDSATHVRVACAEALAAIKGEKATRILCSLLDSDQSDLVAAAATGLGVTDHPDALPPLFEMARSQDRDRRLYAVQGLGASRQAEAVRALEYVAANDPDRDVSSNAIQQLAAIASADSVASLLRLTAQPHLREACVGVLSQLDLTKIDLLARGLTHSEMEVRCAIVDALERKKHPKASKLLAVALDDQHPSVRVAGALALARLGSHSAERKLARLMSSDPDVGVRSAARKALER